MIQFRRIVCPTDFSETATHAVDVGAQMAAKLGAELVLLHVVPEPHYPTRGLGMANAFPQLIKDLHERAKERLEHVHKGISGVTARLELRDGEPYEQILACAKELPADMIVIGTHGYTGIKHAILGSTAERIVRLAECPVLTVRTKA